MRIRAICFLISTWIAPTAIAAQEILIFGGPGHKEFLGCITCGELAANSVWNEMSSYGWQNGFGKWNPFGQFKNPFSTYSACNEFASDPPVMVDKNGNAYGRLTINRFSIGSICGDVGGVERICRALKVMCASN